MGATKKVARKVEKVLEGYSNKPQVQYEGDGSSNVIVHLIGGHWSARQDVEDAFGKRVSQVQNYPTAKRIWVSI